MTHKRGKFKLTSGGTTVRLLEASSEERVEVVRQSMIEVHQRTGDIVRCEVDGILLVANESGVHSYLNR